MSQALTTQDRERLQRVSVATISTCLYRAGVKITCPHGIPPPAISAIETRGQERLTRAGPTRRPKFDC